MSSVEARFLISETRKSIEQMSFSELKNAEKTMFESLQGSNLMSAEREAVLELRTDVVHRLSTMSGVNESTGLVDPGDPAGEKQLRFQITELQDQAASLEGGSKEYIERQIHGLKNILSIQAGGEPVPYFEAGESGDKSRVKYESGAGSENVANSDKTKADFEKETSTGG